MVFDNPSIPSKLADIDELDVVNNVKCVVPLIDDVSVEVPFIVDLEEFSKLA